ncbi:DUF1963 domain-containing protein [Burkholderia sp. Ac-20379]|uniref:DUF1963 domain-containing protein n=1 Tax=Burkholderia sp. Ac-20379 TaxID=2703900 RepID=UPI00197F8F3B|nr:DUF1963 domain-containing protein [Burkholderia sp. Ac-20379]MBN3728030.1 DUF1963 domain-containing protein [Burkholderia sp. Ac-20379]
MTPAAAKTLDALRAILRPASLAEIGGFPPPDDPLTSWFMKGVIRDGEDVPAWAGKPMFPLLQIRVSELPFVPDCLRDVALLVLYYNQDDHVFDAPHGEGWLIREYASLDGLRPLPEIATPGRPFPLRWQAIHDDAPGWEDAWDLLDLSAVNEDEAATDAFFDGFKRYPGTKVGGYPAEVQHGAGVDEFVFQVGSEDKAGWMWVDHGIGYFHRSPEGEWRFSCQFY